MYGHNRAWGHYFCPFLLVFMLTKMAFNRGKWLQCLSQSLTWPLGPGVFLRPVPSCTCGVYCSFTHHCAVSHVDISSSVIKNPNGPHEWPPIVLFFFVFFFFFCFCCCLPAWFLFVSFVLFLMQDVKLTVSEMVCEIELWHCKWRALNAALLI